MKFKATYQQLFELSRFLQVPSKSFANVTEAKKMASLAKAFAEPIKEYNEKITAYAKQQTERMDAVRKEYVDFIAQEKDQKLQNDKQMELDQSLTDFMEKIKDQAEELKATEGATLVEIKLDPNAYDAFGPFFEREAVKFILWQDPDKLAEIALLIDSHV